MCDTTLLSTKPALPDLTLVDCERKDHLTRGNQLSHFLHCFIPYSTGSNKNHGILG